MDIKVLNWQIVMTTFHQIWFRNCMQIMCDGSGSTNMRDFLARNKVSRLEGKSILGAEGLCKLFAIFICNHEPTWRTKHIFNEIKRNERIVLLNHLYLNLQIKYSYTIILQNHLEKIKSWNLFVSRQLTLFYYQNSNIILHTDCGMFQVRAWLAGSFTVHLPIRLSERTSAIHVAAKERNV